jgi:pimeloyl-ACP methyl ester carboxylesterase
MKSCLKVIEFHEFGSPEVLKVEAPRDPQSGEVRIDEDYLPMYQALQVPILLIHAQDDDIVLPAAAEQMLAIRPNTNYVLYNSGAHAPHWENAEQFNQELVSFVSAIF